MLPRRPSLLSPSAHAVLAALGASLAIGCASPVGEPQPPPLRARTSRQALTDAPAYPPRVEVPIGATAEAICARDDGDVKAAFRAYVAARGGTVIRPTNDDVSSWPVLGDTHVCRYCDLEDLVVRARTPAKFAIVDSYAKGAAIGPRPGSSASIQNTYARDARLIGFSDVRAVNADLRCTQWNTLQGFQVGAVDADLSGAFVPDGAVRQLVFPDAVSDLRLTGTSINVLFPNDVDAVRFDGMHDAWIYLGAHVSGTTHLERATGIDLQLDGTMFVGGTVAASGLEASVRGDQPSFTGVDLSTLDAGVTFSPATVASLAVTAGSRWPVGKSAPVRDADLPRVDLTGAVLVARDGETWPAAPVSLDGLRLSHGSFPDGADLSLVSLEGASLERVSFARVTLSKNDRRVSFKGAHLASADLAGKVIDGIDFTNADLRGANLAMTVGSARFDQARAGILGAHVDDNDGDRPKKTSFARAELGTSTFRQTYLDYTDFGAAALADVHFEQAHLDWATFTNARLQRGGLPNTTLKAAASMLATTWDGADLRGVDLSGVDLGVAGGARSSLASAFLCGAKLIDAKLHDTDLVGVFFDVAGDVDFPDGTRGVCVRGDRTGAETSSSSLGTTCPDGHAPASAAGECTDAQWRLAGHAPDACQGSDPLMNGAPCTRPCECQSAFCGPNGTCQDTPRVEDSEAHLHGR